MREVFLLKVGKSQMLEYGTSSRVLKDGDFFKIRDFILGADCVEKDHIFMLHSHPKNFDVLSQDDIDTAIGLRLGLGTDFIVGIVLPDSFRLFTVLLRNKQVKIEDLTSNILNRVYFKFKLKKEIELLRKESQYER